MRDDDAMHACDVDAMGYPTIMTKPDYDAMGCHAPGYSQEWRRSRADLRRAERAPEGISLSSVWTQARGQSSARVESESDSCRCNVCTDGSSHDMINLKSILDHTTPIDSRSKMINLKSIPDHTIQIDFRSKIKVNQMAQNRNQQN